MSCHYLRRGLTSIAVLALATVATLLATLSTTPVAAQSGSRWKVAKNDRVTITVTSGESIQAAIDAAASGTTIVVEPGVYKEQLRIKRSGITLRGMKGATISPGDKQSANDCTFQELGAAICVGSEFVPDGGKTYFGDPSPATRIRNITIKGFIIEGPTGDGIRVVRARNVLVANNTIRETTAVGISIEDVHRFWVEGNRVNNKAKGEFMNVFVGNGAADGRIVRNTILNSPKAGIMVHDARRLRIHDNTVAGGCNGIVSGYWEPGEEKRGPQRLTISKNRIRNNDRACTAFDLPAGGQAVSVHGGRDVVIKKNIIEGHQPQGPTIVTAAVTLAPLGEYGLHNIRFEDNAMSGNVFPNGPADLSVSDPDNQVTVRRNTCTASTPNTNWCTD